MAQLKDIPQRMMELEKAIRALQLANNHFHETQDDAYLLLSQSQLRALICSGGSGMTPLLLDLSDQLGIPLELYSISHQVNIPDPNLAGAILVGKTWSPKLHNGMKKYTLKQWLELPTYYIDSTRDYRTREQVLKHIANKEGGAHYDNQIVAIVDCLKRISGGGQNRTYNGIQMFLLDISALVYWSSMRMGYIWNCRQKSIDETTDPRIAKLDAQFDALVIGVPPMVVQFFT